jgi:hypothetical protein
MQGAYWAQVRTRGSRFWFAVLARTWAVNTPLVNTSVNTESKQRLLKSVTRQAVTEDVTEKRTVSDRSIIDANAKVTKQPVTTPVTTESRHLAWYPKAWYPLWYPRIPSIPGRIPEMVTRRGDQHH